MTFTYDLTTESDLTDVRIALSDTVESTAKFSDEEINYLLVQKSLSVQNTVIFLIRNLIAKIAGNPNFKADWMSVDRGTQLESLNRLLQEKLNEYGLSSGTAGVVHRYRADSLAREEPDYTSPEYDAYDDDDWLYS